MNIATALVIVVVIAALALALRVLRRRGLDDCSSCTDRDSCHGCPHSEDKED